MTFEEVPDPGAKATGPTIRSQFENCTVGPWYRAVAGVDFPTGGKEWFRKRVAWGRVYVCRSSIRSRVHTRSDGDDLLFQFEDLPHPLAKAS